jgi:sugar fermentation stimulation protein A
MNFPELIPAQFIKRENRFTAGLRLEKGELATAFIPTTGRLTGVLIPGCRVWLASVDLANHRKTRYDIVLVELADGGYCCINALNANRLFEEAVKAGKIESFQYKNLKKEVSHGRSRLDFQLSNYRDLCWVEVKSVTYVENGVGMFPDAPTTRGRKHLLELAELAKTGARVSVVFIAQREDAEKFAPHAEIDPEFAKTLEAVNEQGVEIHAYRCDVDLSSITIREEIPHQC